MTVNLKALELAILLKMMHDPTQAFAQDYKEVVLILRIRPKTSWSRRRPLHRAT